MASPHQPPTCRRHRLHRRCRRRSPAWASEKRWGGEERRGGAERRRQQQLAAALPRLRARAPQKPVILQTCCALFTPPPQAAPVGGRRACYAAVEPPWPRHRCRRPCRRCCWHMVLGARAGAGAANAAGTRCTSACRLDRREHPAEAAQPGSWCKAVGAGAAAMLRAALLGHETPHLLLSERRSVGLEQQPPSHMAACCLLLLLHAPPPLQLLQLPEGRECCAGRLRWQAWAQRQQWQLLLSGQLGHIQRKAARAAADSCWRAGAPPQVLQRTGCLLDSGPGRRLHCRLILL